MITQPLVARNPARPAVRPRRTRGNVRPVDRDHLLRAGPARNGPPVLGDRGTSRRDLLRAGLLVPPAVALAGACGRDEPEREHGVREVGYATSFQTFGRDAYVYLAIREGSFSRRGLEVRVQPGIGGELNRNSLRTGEVQFAAMDLAGAAVAAGTAVDADLSADPPDVVEFVAIGAVHQLTLAGIMAVNPAIEAARDLRGRTVGIPPGTVTQFLWPHWLGRVRVPVDEVRVEPLAPNLLFDALASGTVDAIDQFVVGAPTVEAVTGQQPVIMPYSDEFTDLYGIGLYTTTQLAANDPDLCRRFRDGLLEGLANALQRPVDAAAALAEAVPETQG